MKGAAGIGPARLEFVMQPTADRRAWDNKSSLQKELSRRTGSPGIFSEKVKLPRHRRLSILLMGNHLEKTITPYIHIRRPNRFVTTFSKKF